MLKRLRSAHPMLYCLVAEVLFLGMLFVASLLSLLRSIRPASSTRANNSPIATRERSRSRASAVWVIPSRRER